MKCFCIILCGAIASFALMMISNFSTQGAIKGAIFYAICIVVAIIAEFAEDPSDGIKKFFDLIIVAAVAISIIFATVDGQYINNIEIELSDGITLLIAAGGIRIFTTAVTLPENSRFSISLPFNISFPFFDENGK